MAGIGETPRGSRLHIGVFGKTNSGKSSFINYFTGQEVSLVSDVQGTTTDPVYKSIELYPLGPCEIIDTAGLADSTGLGELRLEKTMLAAEKTDIAIIIIGADEPVFASEEDINADDLRIRFAEELKLYSLFKEKSVPVLPVVNKAELLENETKLKAILQSIFEKEPLFISSLAGFGKDTIIPALAGMLPENYGEERITGGLVKEGDTVLLVMPQDIQAPKGRLILPQVQTLRELLDLKCTAVCVTADGLEAALEGMKKAPELIITDSQIFKYVYGKKPAESRLTSFSVLFAAYKGDISYYAEGAAVIESLTEQSRVLIAECCSHAPLTEDIGRVKLPRMLRKRIGEALSIDFVGGNDFPEDLSEYDLIIQCGACMFNRRYVMSRIDRAKAQAIPMTNYGVAIAFLSGILSEITY